MAPKKIYFFIALFFALALNPLWAADQPEDFHPAWWCPGGHAQTIYAALFRPRPRLVLRRERVETPDGDFLDLDRTDGPAGAPLILILHGLASSSASPYVKTLAAKAREKGWRAVLLNARGASGEPNRLGVTHHAGRTDDLETVIRYLIREDPGVKIYPVGFSLGGNVLLKWLGEEGGGFQKNVLKAVAVSAPYDLKRTAENLDRGFNRGVYTRLMLKVLKGQAKIKAKQFPSLFDLGKIRGAETFRIYDRELTSKVNGFKDEEDYWSRSSSGGFLEKIRVPTLLIHAVNDPFLPGSEIPIGKIRANPVLRLLLTSDGGHLGFITGNRPFQYESWLEKKILNFFAE